MSQRMTDDQIEAWPREFSGDLTAARVVLFLKEQLALARRSAEEKDAQIKALADALTFAERRHVPGCPHALCTCGANAALRLAGRPV